MKMCTCDDWDKEMATINSYIMMAYFRNPLEMVTFKVWLFCPWCGKKLIDKED